MTRARTLVLVRHAKTERSHPGGDHARELLPRGHADARAAGGWLAQDAGLTPRLVLCSTAARAQQTWAAMTSGTALAGVPVWTDRRIYQAGPEELLDVLRDLPDDADVVGLVGHSPSVPVLAGDLADAERSDPEAMRSLAGGFPTMACAVLEVDPVWPEVVPGCATLLAVEVPRG